VRIEDLYRLWESGELEEYEAATCLPTAHDDELEPLDERVLMNFHRAGLDIRRAFVANLRLKEQRDEGVIVFRSFATTLTVR
jgi:hypothetical protein